MEKLFERHDEYLSVVPMTYVRDMMTQIDWSLRLIAIKGAKGVGKSTLMQQYIKINFRPDDRHVLYCSADTSYFATHTIVETAEKFVKVGGRYLFIDEIHKYKGWSQEVKEVYDLYKDLHVVVSGSSLLKINDGQADLSRRMVEYIMPGLSFREFLWMETGVRLEAVSLDALLSSPNEICRNVRAALYPLEHFHNYLKYGYFPFSFESRRSYYSRLESVINYLIDVELVGCRGLESGNSRKIKGLLQLLSQMLPYEVDVTKLSKSLSLQRVTVLKYLKWVEEAALIHRLFSDVDTLTDLQKPDKILFDNSNFLYALSTDTPNIGTVRETFFCNQLTSAGHMVEYEGLRSGDFRIDRSIVVEVGGADKGFSQVSGVPDAYIAADDIDSAAFHKIPLWAFGFLY